MRWMASSAYLPWMATELTIVLTLFAMLFKIRSSSSHIPDTPLTSCSLSTSVYLHPWKKPMAQQFIPTHAKPEPVSPGNFPFASIHRQSGWHTLERTQSSLACSWNPALQPRCRSTATSPKAGTESEPKKKQRWKACAASDKYPFEVPYLADAAESPPTTPSNKYRN